MVGAVQHADQIIGKIRSDVHRMKQLSTAVDGSCQRAIATLIIVDASMNSARLAIGPSLRLESALSGSDKTNISFKMADVRLALVKSCVRELAALVQRTQFSTHGYQVHCREGNFNSVRVAIPAGCAPCPPVPW